MRIIGRSPSGLTAALVIAAIFCQAADSAQSSIDVGKQLISTGDFKRAEQHFRRAIRLLGLERGRRYFVATANLGVALYYGGDLREAEATYQVAVALRGELPLDGLPEVAALLNNLAILYGRTGREELAEQVAREAIELREQFKSSDPISLAVAHLTLSVLSFEHWKYSQAERHARLALRILADAGPGGETKLPTVLRQLGITRLKQGAIDEADALLTRAAEWLTTNASPNDPRLALVLSAFGALRLEQQRAGEAEELLERALLIWRASRPPNPAEIASVLNNLAQAYKLTAQYSKAAPLYRKAIVECRTSLGKNSASCALFVANYANLLALQGHLGEAIQQYDDALEILRAKFPNSHPQIAELIRQSQTITALRAGRWTVSVEELQKSLAPH
jgi:tetratricopeptide (TPR) repeat protein